MVNEDGFATFHQFSDKDIVEYEILETNISNLEQKSK